MVFQRKGEAGCLSFCLMGKILMSLKLRFHLWLRALPVLL